MVAVALVQGSPNCLQATAASTSVHPGIEATTLLEQTAPQRPAAKTSMKPVVLEEPEGTKRMSPTVRGGKHIQSQQIVLSIRSKQCRIFKGTGQ